MVNSWTAAVVNVNLQWGEVEHRSNKQDAKQQGEYANAKRAETDTFH